MPKSRRKQPLEMGDESDQYDDEISTFHKDREKILLDSDEGQSDESEEVDMFPIDEADSDDDDDEIANYKQQLRQIRRNKFKKGMDSDLEEDNEEAAAEPESMAWGDKRSWYVGGDVKDNKIILSGSEDEATAGAATLEEKEAMEIQKRHTALMSEEDFMVPTSSKAKDGLKKKKKVKKSTVEQAREEEKKKKKKRDQESVSEDEEELTGLVQSGRDELEKIETDFSKLSKREEHDIMKKLHPEFIPLLNDFNSKSREMQDRILPMMKLVKEGKVDGMGAEYVRMKYHIISNYLWNGTFYMYLMAKRAKGIHEHPVIRRLVQFQNLYKRLVPVDEKLKADLDTILEQLQQGEDVGIIVSQEKTSKKLDKKRKRTIEPKEAALQKRRKTASSEEEESDAEADDDDQLAATGEFMDDEERRAITYQMEKNKGLTVYKKKTARNPRVKHRMKFRRANIRRKGQVRDFKVHKNLSTGEVTGIRAGIIRSRKLK